MTKPKPTITFHIGQHKTGSKALQSFLAVNQVRLLEREILYPIEENPWHTIRAYANSQYRLFALVRWQALARVVGKRDADAYWHSQRPFCVPFASPYEFFEDIAASCERLGTTHAIISAEDFFDMQTAHEIGFSLDLIEAAAQILARLAEDFGFDPRVVIYLRRQDHLLAAHYVQYIKGSPIHDIAFEDFAAMFAPRLDSWSIVSHWVSAFGTGRIHARAYERAALPAGIVRDFCEQFLNLPIDAGWIEPSPDVESVNRTMGRDFLEFLRILNRRHSRSESIYSREDVLETALRIDQPSHGQDTISAWLSPSSRRELLARHDEGNAVISRSILGRSDGVLFSEKPPEDDADWTPYPGLTAEKTVSISLAIHETVLARQSVAPTSC